MIKKTLLALVAMIMCLPFTVKAQAPKAFLTIFEDEIGTFPHELTEEQCALVFEKGETFTIALDVTVKTLSGRNALVCACDPTKAPLTSAIGTNPSPYVAVGTDGSTMYYITSSRGGDKYSGGATLENNTDYKMVYVFDKNAKSFKTYLNKELQKIVLNNNNAFQDFKHLSTNDDTKDNARILIGAGQVKSGGKITTWDTAKDEVEIHSVEFFDTALSLEQIQNILYPREDPLFIPKRTAKASIAEAVATLKNQPGYYSCTINGVKVYDEATVYAAIDAAQSEDEINTIVTAVNDKTIILPEVGKYYRLKGKTSGNYIDAVNCYSGDQMGMKAEDAYSFRGTIFLLDEGNRLKNVATDTYVHGTRHIGQTKNNANTWTFSEGSVVGCLYLTANGTSSHQLHDNTNRADRCGSICNNGTHNFIVEEVPSYTLTVNAPAVAGATGTWNGETKTLPATWALFNGESVANTTLTITSSSHTLTSFKEGDNVIEGNSTEINTLTANRTFTATFTPDIFSSTYGEKWVRLQNVSNKSYWATMENAVTGGSGKTATLDYADEKQLWCLVGTAESFVLYNKAGGENLALKVTDNAYSDGDLATLESDLTATWKLKSQDFGYALVPTQYNNASELGINMYGGSGGDLKLYKTGESNTGSYWLAELADNNPLTLNVEVDKVLESSPRVAELTFTINGKSSQTRITGNVAGPALYLPVGATYEINSDTYRGYTYNNYTNTDGVITVSYTANNERTLFYSPKDGHPYRIPAIATAPNGDIFAICDYRPCNQDIGYGEVDLVCRVSSDNGVTWSEERMIADGKGDAYAEGDATKIWQVGFGDPAIVADRESNKVLVMSVCGNQTCWDGNYGDGGANENPNRMARLYIEHDGEKWVYGEPQEVTYDIYPLFANNNGEAYAASMFIGAGKICQSRVVKKDKYYRLYCAVWAVTKSIRTTHNYVIYSDDFGQSWQVLGGVGNDANPSQPGPAYGGNEPKCEELADGTVVLSSRKSGGRYINLFTFDNEGKSEAEKFTTGSWGTVVATNSVDNGLSFGGNSTNGEIYKVKAVRKSDGKICDIMFQSIPTGSGRDNVAVYYKEMDYTTPYTPTTFSQGWTKGIHVSTKSSCYSTMILQADGRIGFFFEEAPGEYCMVYIPYTIEEMTGGAYALSSAECPTLVEEVNSVLNFIGEGLGKYTVDEENNELLETARTAMENVETVTLSDLNSYKNLLDGATLNMPQPGQYFRVAYDYGGSVGKLYMQGINSGVKSVLFTGEIGNSSVWVYSNSTLTSYYDGRNLRETGSHHGLSDTKTTVTFSESPRAKGKYNIQCERYIHAVKNGENHYADHCQYDENHGTHDLILEEAEVAVENVLIGDWEIGTFYANGAMEIPEGVSAYVATAEPVMEGETGVITLSKIQTGVVPAKTGVIITGKAGQYDFTSVTSDASVGENFMCGYAGPETMKKVTLTNDASYYILTVVNQTPGFYKKAYDFNVYNNKAYLKLPASQANSIRFRFNNNDGTTDIIEVPTEALNADGAIYDLSGRRVEKAKKGVYIVNGKKVIF